MAASNKSRRVPTTCTSKANLWRCLVSLSIWLDAPMLQGPCSSQDQAHLGSEGAQARRGLNLGPRMTFNINKPIKNLVFLKGQLSKLIKNFMFLKVDTRNFDRGLSFESAKRSSPIGVSISSQNEHIRGSRQSHRIPSETGHGVQQATTRTRARGEDDGSSTNSLKLLLLLLLLFLEIPISTQ